MDRLFAGHVNRNPLTTGNQRPQHEATPPCLYPPYGAETIMAKL